MNHTPYRRWRTLACALALLAFAPAAAWAEDACAPGGSASSASTSPSRDWPPPLDRPLTFDARDLSLRDALDRLSAAARVRISYSAQLLPLDRRVCVSPAARTLGGVLAELLRDTQVEAVAAGADHVVLTPRRLPRQQADAAAGEADELGHTVALERIVVTGSAGGGPQRALPFALDVIDRGQLEREGTAPLTRFLNAATAGPWGWEEGPSSLSARYGSIRGASSFGVSSPKVFIDGIEVANPLLAMRLAPESVERVEVIRGPQGAALYGTDAISGVVNIVTRHEGTDAGAPRLRVRGGLGLARSDFGIGAFSREGAAAFRAGTSVRSVGVDVGFGGVGNYVPGAGGHYLLASGSARSVGRRAILTGTARFYSAAAGAPANPLLRQAALLAADTAERQRTHQYTLGGTARWTWSDRWTHTVIAGVDGNRVAGLPDDRTPVPSAAESALRSSEGGADRATLRWSTVGRVRDGERTDLSLTLAAEHSVLRQEIAADDLFSAHGELHPARGLPLVTTTHGTGLVAQGNASLDDRLQVTAGLRLERNDGLTDRSRYAAFPVLGIAYVTDVGTHASLKVRAAYGKGIRPARSPGREQAWAGAHAQLQAGYLAPEEQSGIEAGFDLAVGGVLSLQVTGYDQLASGLIQRVAQPVDADAGPRRTPFILQNVGQISNRGWEMQGTAELGRLSLTGAFSAVDSRVRRVALAYSGDLRVGDRMLEVPARTLALTGAWAADRWSLSLTGTRAFDWINYDRMRLARDFVLGHRDPADLAGAQLREYWREYAGSTRLNAVGVLDVRPGVALVLTADNLLDHQRGEPDNLALIPGRTLTLGIRAAF